MSFLNHVVKFIAIEGVNFYRRFISPYKGFHCGHAYHTGSSTCSTYGLKQLQTQTNTLEAIRLIQHRLKACSHVNHLFMPPQITKKQYIARNQGGFVDCGGCDLPSCDMPSCDMNVPDCNIGNISNCDNCCDCGDIFDFNKKSKNEVVNMLPLDTAMNASNLLTKKKGSYIIPGFQLLDELEDDYLLYLYNPRNEYYKIHKKCIDCALKDILNTNTYPKTYKLNKNEAKKALLHKKKVNLNKN